MTSLPVLSDVPVVERIDGWDFVGRTHMAVKGTVLMGVRESAKSSSGAWVMRACIAYAVAEWTPIEFADAVADDRLRGGAAYPITAEHGVDVALVALADDMHGSGGWRWGSYPELQRVPFVAAKVKAGELVAFLAPCVLPALVVGAA